MDFFLAQEQYCFEHKRETSPTILVSAHTMHAHDEYEIMYIPEGDLDCRIEDRRYSIRPHSLVIFQPGQMHSLIIHSAHPFERYVVRFPPEEPRPQLREMLRSLGSIYVIPGTRIAEEFERMNLYYQEIPKDQVIHVLIHQLAIILNYACNIIAMRQLLPTGSTMTGAQIVAYIQKNLTAINTIADICDNVHLSASSVQKLTMPVIHQPVMAYVREQKCRLGRQLMERGAAANLVCFQCGFQNYSTFYRAYCKTFNTPPSDSRKDSDNLRV